MKYFIRTFFIVFTSTSFSQVVYVTDNQYEADYSVYVTKNKYEADWLIYITNNRYDAEEGRF